MSTYNQEYDELMKQYNKQSSQLLDELKINKNLNKFKVNYEELKKTMRKR